MDIKQLIEKIESIPESMDGLLISELKPISATLADVKREILIKIKEKQKQILDSMEVAVLAGALIRNSDPEYAAKAQGIGTGKDILTVLEEKRQALRAKLGTTKADAMLNTVGEKIVQQINDRIKENKKAQKAKKKDK